MARKRDPRREYSRLLAKLPEDRRQRLIIAEDLGASIALWEAASGRAELARRRALRAADLYQDARETASELGALVDAFLVLAARASGGIAARRALASIVQRRRLGEARARLHWPKDLETLIAQAKEEHGPCTAEIPT